jgi:hypothetical protein
MLVTAGLFMAAAGSLNPATYLSLRGAIDVQKPFT